MERCKAQQTIHAGNYDSADWKGIYSLYLLAWGDEQLARKAQGQAAEIYADREVARRRR
ncbi:MAG: hypothetical protein WCK00_14315 [Deltaproteobacteria bacterium]